MKLSLLALSLYVLFGCETLQSVISTYNVAEDRVHGAGHRLYCGADLDAVKARTGMSPELLGWFATCHPDVLTYLRNPQ